MGCDDEASIWAVIIIVVPPYTGSSNGIKSVHKIAHTINQLGGDARLVIYNGGFLFDGKQFTNPELNTPCLKQEDKQLLLSSIVVYPEIIPGNPLCASRVVRYLGNKDGLLTGKKMGSRSGDFLLAHSKVIEPNADCVLFNAEFNPAFNDTGVLSRDMDATYVGKGHIYGKCSIMANTLYIDRTWPYGAEQLAYVLRRTRFFYTWDSWTATNVDAILCGAVPYFLRYEPWTEAELDGSELGEIPRMDANHTEFYPLEFQKKRRKLIKRIDELNATWENRVREFIGRVEAHFSV
jgi:hypothetical protein